MNSRNLSVFLIAFCANSWLIAQQDDSTKIQNILLDSLFIDEVENTTGKAKLLHAEPLFIDLIRDLGARKGEKEWNFGFGMTDNIRYDQYGALVEYEFALIDRLGFEIELPFTFYYGSESENLDTIPASRLNGLKLATQYTFLVNEKMKLSSALGYIHEFEMAPFKSYNQNPFTGNIFNPFFVVAKRWGNNFHSLFYTGPIFTQHFNIDHLSAVYQMNTNFHYMIKGTRNFIGLEFNKEFSGNDFDLTIRPQMRVSITDDLLIGIVTGIPIKRENERFSTFVRLIYEPGHRKKDH